MTRRLIQLFSGLILYGLSIALIVRADLGLDPASSLVLARRLVREGLLEVVR